MTSVVRIGPAGALSAEEFRALRSLVGLMIPASSEYEVPGADDASILRDIASSLGRDHAAVRQALQHLNDLTGGAFADAPDEMRETVTQRFRDAHPLLAAVLVAVTTRCYYRDDRVMRALGMEPRPPFPKGFEVEQGDWSLLDPVRERGKIYRDTP